MKKIIIVTVLLSIVVLGILCGFGYYRYNKPADLKADIDIKDKNYDAETDLTVLTCEVKVKNPNYDFGRTVTSLSYIISLKGKNDMTIHEVFVEPESIIEKDDYTVEISFNDGGTYEAVKGEVKRAEIRVVDAGYENSSRYRMDNGGEKYDTHVAWVIVNVVSFFLVFSSIFLEIMTPSSNGGNKRVFLRYLFYILFYSLGYQAFLQGAMKILSAMLA